PTTTRATPSPAARPTPTRRGRTPTTPRPRRRPRGTPTTSNRGLHVARDLTISLDEIELRASRSSGPGGQHANVTASRIEAVFDVAASRSLSEDQKGRIIARCGPVVRAVAQDARSQARNRELALTRLQERLARGLH